MKGDKVYLASLKKRYIHAKRKEKKVILDEFTKTTGYERKYAIKLSRGSYLHVQGPIKRPRGRKYTEQGAIILYIV